MIKKVNNIESFTPVNMFATVYVVNGYSDCARGEKFYDTDSDFTGCTITLLANQSNPPSGEICKVEDNCK